MASWPPVWFAASFLTVLSPTLPFVTEPSVRWRVDLLTQFIHVPLHDTFITHVLRLKTLGFNEACPVMKRGGFFTPTVCCYVHHYQQVRPCRGQGYSSFHSLCSLIRNRGSNILLWKNTDWNVRACFRRRPKTSKCDTLFFFSRSFFCLNWCWTNSLPLSHRQWQGLLESDSFCSKLWLFLRRFILSSAIRLFLSFITCSICFHFRPPLPVYISSRGTKLSCLVLSCFLCTRSVCHRAESESSQGSELKM